jgi:light-regulated signal transduction histidine kinase (bacteriophytochrome)
MLTRMQQTSNIDDMCAVAVGQLRALIEFDRVMIYRFLQDGSGSVIAESRGDGVASFLDHHYPASDIPQQARELYTKNWLRLIADVHSPSIPVLASAAEQHPLDMSFCGVRSVSPIHIEYLKNMNVAASLSISVVVGGSLWGLIACHHSSPRIVPPDLRMAAEFFGQAFSLQLQTLARADVADMLRDARDRIDRIVLGLALDVPLPDSLGPRLEDIASILPCDGAALWFDDRLVSIGACPPENEIPRIANALKSAGHTAGVFATHELSLLHPPAAEYSGTVSGLMALPLSRRPDNFLMLFRREFVRTIDWAGNPEKSVDLTSPSRLSPRKSFELWRQEVKNQSRIWEPHDRLTAEALRMSLLEIALKYSEVVAQERARAASLERLQKAEFNHRTKNALALVGALVAQSKEHSRNISGFVADLEGRIRSIAMAHDLASRPGTFELRRLLEMEIEAFSNCPGERIVLDGPKVMLGEAAGRVMALIVHELATNALKYGALSGLDGMVRVEWRVGSDGGCMIEWRESGGPAVKFPGATGFGTFLIEHQVPFELDGRASIRYEPTGVEASFWIPATGLAGGGRTEPASGTAAGKEALPHGLLTGCKVLLVEDNLIIALELERTLRRLGASDVYAFGTLARAQHFVGELAIDIAVLDVNLNNATSYDLADILIDRGIPFVFVTGYGLEFRAPERFSDVPVVGKPASIDDFAIAIQSAVATASQKVGRP